MFFCPRCTTPLGDQTSTGILETVCVKCRIPYYIITGEMMAESSHQITHRGDTADRPGEYEREYELRLALPGGRLMRAPFRIPGRDDRIILHQDDLVSVMAVIRNDSPDDIVRVINHTTDTTYPISEPGARARDSGWFAAAVVGGLLAFALPSFGLGTLSLPIALGAAAGAFWLVRGSAAPMRSLTPAVTRRLEESQALLAQKVALVEDRATIEKEIRDRGALRDRLIALRAKMEDVGRDVYGSRIDTIDRAIALFDQQLDVNRQLVAAYERTIRIVDIEIEALATIGTATDDVVDVLDRRTRELEELRERHAELTRQLEANEEVERVLKS